MSKPALWKSLPSYQSKAKPSKKRFIRVRKPSRARDERIYRLRVKEWLKEPENRYCAVMQVLGLPPKPATECHHYAGRRNKLLLYEPYWKPVSAEGHAWVGSCPAKAMALGMICRKSAWNCFPKEANE